MINSFNTGLSNGLLQFYGWPNQASKNGDINNSFIFSPFMNSAFDNRFRPQFLGLNNFDYNFNSDYLFFNQDLILFDMLMSNQMPFTLQNNLLNKSYNTKTDLVALKNVYNPTLGSRLANISENNAEKTNTIGWCAGGTNTALEKSGLAKGETRVAAAYQEIGVLEHHKNFKDVTSLIGNKKDLASLPAGCVVIFDKNNDKNHVVQNLSDEYGHIFVTLGDGQAASDHIENLKETLPKYSGQYHVFVPIDSKDADKKT